jgi:hypothetical protein
MFKRGIEDFPYYLGVHALDAIEVAIQPLVLPHYFPCGLYDAIQPLGGCLRNLLLF